LFSPAPERSAEKIREEDRRILPLKPVYYLDLDH
jgi:hypothetical protein